MTHAERRLAAGRRRTTTTTTRPPPERAGRIETWHVDWVSLAWLWGFLVALALIAIWWIWQYRRPRDAAADQDLPDRQLERLRARRLARPSTLFLCSTSGSLALRSQ